MVQGVEADGLQIHPSRIEALLTGTRDQTVFTDPLTSIVELPAERVLTREEERKAYEGLVSLVSVHLREADPEKAGDVLRIGPNMIGLADFPTENEEVSWNVTHIPDASGRPYLSLREFKQTDELFQHAVISLRPTPGGISLQPGLHEGIEPVSGQSITPRNIQTIANLIRSIAPRRIAA